MIVKREKVHKGDVGVVYTKDLNYNVPKMLLDFIRANKIEHAIDLGSGYGFVLYALSQYELLPRYTVGVEWQFGKSRSLKSNVPEAKIICADITKALKADKFFDLVINEQVIEHIHDQDSLLRNIHQMLKDNGKLYITSIIRKRWAWWFYKYKGEVRLHPGHVREYGSVEEFLSFLKRNGFKVVVANERKFILHLFYWIDILLVNFFKIDSNKLGKCYDRNLPLRLLRRHFAFFIPGFYLVEALAEKD